MSLVTDYINMRPYPVKPTRRVIREDISPSTMHDKLGKRAKILDALDDVPRMAKAIAAMADINEDTTRGILKELTRDGLAVFHPVPNKSAWSRA